MSGQPRLASSPRSVGQSPPRSGGVPSPGRPGGCSRRAVDWPNDLRVGFHLSIADGPVELFRRFSERGCSALQLFLGSPRTWEAPAWRPERLTAFREERCRHGSPPVVAHTRYLLNLASATDLVRTRSIATLRLEYQAAAQVGADFLVLHMGSHADHDRGLEHMVSGLRESLEGVAGPHPLLLLENTAGEANDLGACPADIAAVRHALPFPTGVCWDTCHAFAAGFDLASSEGRDRLIGELARAFGAAGVAVVHLNDSLFPCGSHRDRHAHLDGGHMGAANLAAFLLSPLLRGVPVILETPQAGADDPADDRANLSRLRRAFARWGRKPGR